MARYTMFRSPKALAAVVLLVCGDAVTAWGAPGYALGRPAAPREIAGWDIDVLPDGTGLPPGHGSVPEGQAIYDQKCAGCHGTFGESGDYVQLAGGVGSLKTAQPVRTVGSLLDHATTLWDYINRAMPFPNSKTLTANEVYSLTAYVLNLNEILPADATLDQSTLPKVKMPNQHGFTTAHGFLSVDGKPDTRNVACMSNCPGTFVISSELPAHFTQENYGDISAQFRGLATMNAHGARATGPVASASPAAGSAASTRPDTGSAFALAQANSCTICHAADHRMVGPGFREVAEKYKGDATAEARLVAKVRAGGSGVWGPVPMPAQTSPSDDDLRRLVEWVLSGATTP